MAYSNLQGFVEDLRCGGELREISALVDAELEITEITRRVVKDNGPALLFNNVKGSKIPLVTNLFGSFSRIEKALGVTSLDEIAQRFQQFLDLKVPENLLQKLQMIPKLRALEVLAPKKVKGAPCQEIVIKAGEGPILDQLPVMKCWPDDGGKYITFPLVITKNPKTNQRNVGLYRMQVYDNVTTGMHWQIHKDGAEHYRALPKGTGARLEVAAVLGADPATMFAAACPLPRDIDELMLAGFLRGASVEIVPCKTVALEVPAQAEIILEGYVEEGDLRTEGPFGDHTGFYSRAKEFPVFHITCMTRRKNPLYVSTVVGRPPMEDCYIGSAIERIFLPIIQKQLPEIVDIHMPWEGCFHNMLIVAIRKSYPGHAQKVMHAIWGLGQMMFSKCILVTDADTAIRDLREVSWRTLNNVDPKRDIVFTEGPVDELDHSADRDFFGSKMGIDATRKSAAEGMQRPWPGDIVMNCEIIAKVTQRWSEYGLP